MNTIFEIKQLNLYYKDFHALKNINLSIKKNKVIALIGPSGCGKSTFLRCLNKMNDLIDHCKIEGTILFDNENILDKEYDVISLRKKVGMVFQKPNPFPMSIYENIVYGLKCQGIKDKKYLDEVVKTSLKQAALWEDVKDCLHKNAYSLSGGQQQRLCIARSIAMKPEVILMDEPTSALDPIATKKIEDLIEQLKKNYTILIVTHSMQQAKRISDETIFFYQGEMLEKAPTPILFQRPLNKKCEDYITGRFG